jgi:hypothetical protein
VILSETHGHEGGRSHASRFLFPLVLYGGTLGSVVDASHLMDGEDLVVGENEQFFFPDVVRLVGGRGRYLIIILGFDAPATNTLVSKN